MRYSESNIVTTCGTSNDVMRVCDCWIQSVLKTLKRASYTVSIDQLAPKMIERYHKFLQLKVKYPELLLIPTLDIELVWQSHLIRPSVYANDLDRLFGMNNARVLD
jgi:hypothetical protein